MMTRRGATATPPALRSTSIWCAACTRQLHMPCATLCALHMLTIATRAQQTLARRRIRESLASCYTLRLASIDNHMMHKALCIMRLLALPKGTK